MIFLTSSSCRSSSSSSTFRPNWKQTAFLKKDSFGLETWMASWIMSRTRSSIWLRQLLQNRRERCYSLRMGPFRRSKWNKQEKLCDGFTVRVYLKFFIIALIPFSHRVQVRDLLRFFSYLPFLSLYVLYWLFLLFLNQIFLLERHYGGVWAGDFFHVSIHIIRVMDTGKFGDDEGLWIRSVSVLTTLSGILVRRL